MRWIIRLIILMAVLYGGYWFYARGQVQTSIETALRDTNADGQVTVTQDAWATRGFPSRFDTTFENIRIADENTGLTWAAPWLQVFALAYRPNEVITVWPEVQTIDLDGETFTLYTADMRASAKVRANTALSFNQATIDIDNPRLRRESDGAELAMARVLAAMRASPGTDATYDLYFDASSIVLPEWLRVTLDPEGQMPPLFRQVQLEAAVTLTKPLDRHAGEGEPVSLELLEVQSFSAAWGELSISIIGELAPDANGVSEGSFTISATGWQQALAMATAAGWIEAGFDTTFATMADQLDETPHIEETLTVTVFFADGQALLGPLPIGPAPIFR